MQEIINLWKENKVHECIMRFSCGGDSMNETEFTLYDKDGKELNCPEITDYFENEVYDNVEFYVNSDGYYQGEAGTVTITLDDEEEGFSYYKDALAEFSEEYTGITSVELSQDELDFIKKYARIILGGEENKRIVYKRDCILNNDAVRIQEDLMEKIYDIAREYENPNADGEAGEWFTFTTSIDDEEIQIENNELKVQVTQSYYVTRPSEN